MTLFGRLVHTAIVVGLYIKTRLLEKLVTRIKIAQRNHNFFICRARNSMFVHFHSLGSTLVVSSHLNVVTVTGDTFLAGFLFPLATGWTWAWSLVSSGSNSDSILASRSVRFLDNNNAPSHTGKGSPSLARGKMSWVHRSTKEVPEKNQLQHNLLPRTKSRTSFLAFDYKEKSSKDGN